MGGKGCLTVFFLVFLIAGAAATFAVLADAVRTAAVWFWTEVECTVIESGVEETGDDSEPYRPSVIFEYQIDGRTYRSNKIARGSTASSSYDAAGETSERFPPGTISICRVDPDFESDAVLERRFPWVVFVVFFTLIFVAVGAGGLYFTWRGPPGIFNPGGGESISQRARGAKGAGRKIGLVVGLVFVAVGGGLSVFLLVIPVAGLVMATTWVETPAVVVASTLRSWSTDDGTTYRADILYEYETGGRTWRSNRRSFFPIGSGDDSGQRVVVDRYPKGSTTHCFVHPDDPSRSVLDRRPRPVYLIGLFPLAFLLAGWALAAGMLRKGKTSAGRPEQLRGQTAVEAPQPEATLEPEAGPIAKVVGMVIIAAIWNGIISVFLWQVYKGFAAGNPEWFLTIFMIPFVLVGLALIIGIFYMVLASFNPRPKLTITPSSPRLGTRLRIGWRFTGRTGRITRLEIALEGHEKATYRRGTDTHTDRLAFASFDLVATSNDWEIPQGTAEIEIPDDTMHSFTSNNNGVVWTLIVLGDIPRWPDVMETFEIEVRPMARERLLP